MHCFFQKTTRPLAKISVSRVFWDPIKNRVSPRSALLEAVYLEALLYLFIISWNFAMDYPVVHYYTLHCSLFVSFPGLCEKRTFSWCTVNPHQSLFPLCSHFINVPRPSMYQQVKVNKKVAYGNIISKRAESPLSVHHHWLDVVIGPVHSGTTSRKTSQKQGWKSQTWKWFT